MRLIKSLVLPNKFMLFVIVFVVVIFNSSIINAAAKEEYEVDRVIGLPGQPPNLTLSQFSGYITVNEAHGRALFYWFFEVQSHPITKPLLLWLNGGPGCSSIGYGAAVELGPLIVGKNGETLEFNPHSWNKEANLLFLESPIGVGFSYSNTSDDFTNINDSFVAVDAYTFLVNWLERFPHFKNHDFYISGESYAGHYVPQLAELVYDRNKMTTEYPYINLKGFIVGNPETDDYFDSKGFVEYAWSHSIVSDDEFDNVKRACDFKLKNWSRECNKAVNVIWDVYEEIDVYNIYAPSCLDNKKISGGNNKLISNAKTQNNILRRMNRIPGGYDPCYSKYTEAYFNRIDVQLAMHVESPRLKPTVQWKVCNGDADGRVPVIGSRYCVEALKLPLKTPWRTWIYNHQVAGRMVEYEGLTLVTMRGAGHLVPLNKPKEALALIHYYLSNKNI